MKRYINLNTHSNCSMGETVITPEEIVEFAVRDGADAVALTDLNSVHGFREFAIAAEKYKDRGFKPIYGVQLYGLNQEKSITPRKFTLLAKNQKGLKNIYKIMSLGYSKILSEDKWPCVSYKDIQDNREGVLVGLECTKSDVYQVWTDDEQDHEGEKLNHLLLEEYAIADYVGIKPWKSYAGVMDDLAGVLYPEEVDTKWLIKKISGGLKAVHKLAIATNNSNCITEQDELCFNILHDYSSDMQTHVSRLLTTEMVLADYILPERYTDKFLGSDMAQEIVLDNTNTIADMIEDVVVTDTGYHPFSIDGAEEKLKVSCEKALLEKYGEKVPGLIKERYESELENIISHGFASYYVLAAILAKKSKEIGYLHNLRGCAGGSFIVYLMGISETNPLPPHYYCPKCKRVEFVDAVEYPSGFDLNRCDIERKLCPECGEQLIGDGHNIPVEFFAGYDGDKVPDFDFNFSSDIQKDMVKYLGEIFGEDKTFYAGTKGTFSYRLAEHLVDSYCREHDEYLTPTEMNIVKERISHVYKVNGRHPSGIVIVPEENEIYDFTPVGYSGQLQMRDTDQSHYTDVLKPSTMIEYHNLPLEKIDVLGHSMLTKLKLMEEFSGVDAKSIKLEDIDIFSFFMGDSFKGLPFDGDFARKVADEVFPVRFSDLVEMSGFAHGTSVWTGNGENLAGTVCDPGELIAHRDDVMLTLIRHGIERKTAFEIAEMVRKGRAERNLSLEQEILLREHGVPDWYVDSMKKIRYLFPKAHATEYVMNYLRMIWYKVYHPVAFYAAVLSLDIADFFDYSILAEGRKRTELELKRFDEEWGADHEFDHWNGEGWAEAQKEVLEIALECYERGIEFLPADINISDSKRFLPEGSSIRIPFNCPVQIDEEAEKIILKERALKPFESFEDFAGRTNLSEYFIQAIRKNSPFAAFEKEKKLHFEKISGIADSVMREEYFLKESDKRPASEKECPGEIVNSGIDSLDDKLHSFENGHLYLIGGRPAMGKTTLMLQIASNASLTTDKPVYILSLEMSGEQMVQRLISQIVDIDQHVVRSGSLSKKQRELMINCWARMDSMPIYICDTVASMEEIKRFVEEEISDGILLIDYFQLIDGSTYNRKNSPVKKALEIRMTEIARELNYLAKEKNIPIVVCSQLTRTLEQRADKRPVLHDLNMTIKIEQYVDGVIFIYRDAYYTNDGGEEAELILAKNHQGTVGTAKTRFNRERLLYENI